MPKFILTLEYDGTKFAGWQRQSETRNVRTVQDEIEKALLHVLHEPVDVIGAGRTDAGVHARGQVAHVEFKRTDIDTTDVLLALRGVLPNDIVCPLVAEAAADFHARFDAVRRSYSYTISTSRRAIGRMYAWHAGWNLDIHAMKRAAAYVMGTHDFTAYSKENAEVKNRVCEVVRSEWIAIDSGLRYEISADRFVYSMIRALVGAMVAVGRGRIIAEEVHAILQRSDRSLNKTALAPPHGLCLERVDYPISKS